MNINFRFKKQNNSVIIYSPCCFKPTGFSFFCRT